MKAYFLVAVLFLAGVSVHAQRAYGHRSYSYVPRSSSDERVRSYTTHKGSYVGSHMRSAPDDTRRNNFSHSGNLNPYTSKRGYKR